MSDKAQYLDKGKLLSLSSPNCRRLVVVEASGPVQVMRSISVRGFSSRRSALRL